MERECVSPQQVAQLAILSVKTVYNLHSKGQMPQSFKFGRRVRWLASDIEDWLEGHRA
jgi:predicted DNA-binding transcriptional regulator AlpA